MKSGSHRLCFTISVAWLAQRYNGDFRRPAGLSLCGIVESQTQARSRSKIQRRSDWACVASMRQYFENVTKHRVSTVWVVCDVLLRF